MIDTNIAIYARDGNRPILDRLADKQGQILISALCVAELQRGLTGQHPDATVRRARVEILLAAIPVIPFDAAAAMIYGQIIAQCGLVRSRDFDRMIAAHAIASQSILITNNLADFQDIPRLKTENWA